MHQLPELTSHERDRFLSKIQVGGCGLVWRGPLNNKNYGAFRIYRNGTTIRFFAHRMTYKLFKGQDPGDQVVRHACDTPTCVTPDCLLLGTQADNIHDAMERGRVDFSGLMAFHEVSSAMVQARILTGEKSCPRCGKTKLLAEFTKDARRLDGHGSYCLECHRSLGRAPGRGA